jgi:hypothetical protein
MKLDLQSAADASGSPIICNGALVFRTIIRIMGHERVKKKMTQRNDSFDSDEARADP